MIGHHGSKSSTSQKFLDAVNPKFAVIQVGKDNNYGHPTTEVLKRLNDKKIKIYRNDEQGNIIFTANGN
jgi:competence protein ComEC